MAGIRRPGKIPEDFSVDLLLPGSGTGLMRLRSKQGDKQKVGLTIKMLLKGT